MSKSSNILSLTMRPKRLPEMVGQATIVRALRSAAERDRLPNSFLLVGDTGTGKTTLARIIATSLNCTHGPFGEPCDVCLKSDFMINEVNASEINGVNEIRSVAETALYEPLPPSKCRVIILDEAQMLTRNAQNLLLKYLEESPKSTVWITCTTNPEKILTTLKGRCMTYTLRGLSSKGRGVLLERGAGRLGYSDSLEPLKNALDEIGETSARNVLMALELVVNGVPPKRAVTGDAGAEFDAIRIARAMVSGNTSKVVEALGDMKAEHSQWVKASVTGYLRSIVLKGDSPRVRKAAAEAVVDILSHAPLDDQSLYTYLVGQVYKWAPRFRG